MLRLFLATLETHTHTCRCWGRAARPCLQVAWTDEPPWCSAAVGRSRSPTRPAVCHRETSENTHITLSTSIPWVLRRDSDLTYSVMTATCVWYWYCHSLTTWIAQVRQSCWTVSQVYSHMELNHFKGSLWTFIYVSDIKAHYPMIFVTQRDKDLHVFRCPVQQDLHFPWVFFPPGYNLDTKTSEYSQLSNMMAHVDNMLTYSMFRDWVVSVRVGPPCCGTPRCVRCPGSRCVLPGWGRSLDGGWRPWSERQRSREVELRKTVI